MPHPKPRLGGLKKLFDPTQRRPPDAVGVSKALSSQRLGELRSFNTGFDSGEEAALPELRDLASLEGKEPGIWE
jgi:hypothetical protein